MAGVVNFASLPPVSKPIWRQKAPSFSSFTTYNNSRRMFVTKSSAETTDTSSTKVKDTISAPVNFKAPDPKLFMPRSDQVIDVITASFNLLFRLGTGVFVDGYNAFHLLIYGL